MSTRLHRGRRWRTGSRTPPPPRRRAARALRTATIALLAALLIASAFATAAHASTGSTGAPRGAAAVALAGARTRPDTPRRPLGDSPAIRPLTAPGELLAPGQLEELLAKLPLRDLSAAQVAHYLAGLEDIHVLASLRVGLLGSEELGVPALEESLSKSIEALGAGATIGELANTSKLLPTLEARLDGLLTALLGSDLGSDQQQQLAATLGTLDVDQLVGTLLGTAREPTQLSALSDLAGALFAELGAAPLEDLLGGSLAGDFAPSTVENVARELHTAPEAVSDELGQSAARLPATATLLTAPVSNGKLLAVAPAVKGLALGLLGATAGEGAGEGGTGGKGSTGEGGGASTGGGSGAGGSGADGSGSGSGGGSGSGAGGSGTDGSGAGGGSTGAPGGGASGGEASGLTLVVDVPPAAGAASNPARAGKSPESRRIAILGSRTRGTVATVALRTPAAGRLVLRGPGIAPRTRRVAGAARVTLTVRLSQAGAALLRRHRHPLKVELHASFTTSAGARSSATAAITFG